jgi:GNAT superfamily N-acetyltransferase
MVSDGGAIPFASVRVVIEFATNLAGVSADQLQGPFFVGWPNPPDRDTHLRILRGSDHVVLAIQEPERQVVGFITAITDGILSAFIPLLEVVPDYQGRGIGSDLVRRMLDEIGDLYAVDAMADSELHPFYEHLGLHSAPGVALRNYDRQSGRL